MPNYYYSFMVEWGSWICGMGMLLLVMFCLIVGFVFYKKFCLYFSEKFDQEDNVDNPKEICKNRDANGEINRDEFLEKKKNRG